MEMSIAVHSVIIGFDLGTLGKANNTSIQALMIAFVFHQFFEGISLGSTISQTKLSNKTCSIFGLFFALTLPVGVIIGWNTTSTPQGDVVKSVATCLATGTLMYTALIEMLAEDFSEPELMKRPFLKLQMYFALCLGVFFLALLANWA